MPTLKSASRLMSRTQTSRTFRKESHHRLRKCFFFVLHCEGRGLTQCRTPTQEAEVPICPKQKKMHAFKPLHDTAEENMKSKHRYTPLPHCPSHPNPLVTQIRNYTLADLTNMNRKYKHTRTKHKLL
jgi:hypothetical protein